MNSSMEIRDLKLENNEVTVNTFFRNFKGELVPNTLRVHYVPTFLWYFCVVLLTTMFYVPHVYMACHWPPSHNSQKCLHDPAMWLVGFVIGVPLYGGLFAFFLVDYKDWNAKRTGIAFKIYHSDSDVTREYVYTGKKWEKFYEELSALNKKK